MASKRTLQPRTQLTPVANTGLSKNDSHLRLYDLNSPSIKKAANIVKTFNITIMEFAKQAHSLQNKTARCVTHRFKNRIDAALRKIDLLQNENKELKILLAEKPKELEIRFFRPPSPIPMKFSNKFSQINTAEDLGKSAPCDEPVPSSNPNLLSEFEILPSTYPPTKTNIPSTAPVPSKGKRKKRVRVEPNPAPAPAPTPKQTISSKVMRRKINKSKNKPQPSAPLSAPSPTSPDWDKLDEEGVDLTKVPGFITGVQIRSMAQKKSIPDTAKKKF